MAVVVDDVVAVAVVGGGGGGGGGVDKGFSTVFVSCPCPCPPRAALIDEEPRPLPLSGCRKLAASTLAAPETNRSAVLRSLRVDDDDDDDDGDDDGDDDDDDEDEGVS